MMIEGGMTNNLNVHTRPTRQEGFTLTELAVVIGVVGLLAVMALTALAHSRPQDHLIYCANNLRQVGMAFEMYTKDNAGKLPQVAPGIHYTVDFNSPYAADNPLKLLRPYVGAKNPMDRTPVYACPAAQPHRNLAFAPTLYSDCNVIPSQLILEKGITWVRNPAGLVFVQEHLVRMNVVFYEPENVGNDRWSQWHCWRGGSDFEWSGSALEYYISVHDNGGNLLYVDGHVGYKRYVELNSLDFGLLDLNGNPAPYQPTEVQSRASFMPAY
jgi:prepilin-type N-terminal cleavage/methylation domain-containing protein/prepilin-type processing-associated H-X9-DG protein